MDIRPTPEFLEACRRVLGGDDPATVLGAMRDDDQSLFNRVRDLHTEILRAHGEMKG